tara:strand:+ start:6257 stop:6883 length:627 start_codon:yes stop_codon:yes gene_type:complete
MLVDMMKPEDVEMQSLIDEYLTEDDKSLVFKKVQSNKAMGIHGGNSFVLYSNANKVKEFVENGHYVQFIAYGIDYMILKESGTFTLRANDFDSIDQLTEFTSEYMFDWYQDTGDIDMDLLDKIYAWLLVSPYQAMAMSECARDHLHKTVDYLWMCTVVENKAFSSECYGESKRLINSKLDHWFNGVSILRRGCGYENIIKPMEFEWTT